MLYLKKKKLSWSVAVFPRTAGAQVVNIYKPITLLFHIPRWSVLLSLSKIKQPFLCYSLVIFLDIHPLSSPHHSYKRFFFIFVFYDVSDLLSREDFSIIYVLSLLIPPIFIFPQLVLYSVCQSLRSLCLFSFWQPNLAHAARVTRQIGLQSSVKRRKKLKRRRREKLYEQKCMQWGMWSFELIFFYFCLTNTYGYQYTV